MPEAITVQGKLTTLKNKTGVALYPQTVAQQVIVGMNEDNTATVNLTSYLADLNALVNDIGAAKDVMKFKGIVDATNGLPTEGYLVGDTYRVTEAGTYAGEVCEAGDIILCIKDYAAGTAADSDWTVFQVNIDGAVVGPTSAVADNFAVFSGVSGHVIADSGISKADVQDTIDKAHTHENKTVLDGLSADEDGNLLYDGDRISDGTIGASVITAGGEIPENLRTDGLVIEVGADFTVPASDSE